MRFSTAPIFRASPPTRGGHLVGTETLSSGKRAAHDNRRPCCVRRHASRSRTLMAFGLWPLISGYSQSRIDFEDQRPKAKGHLLLLLLLLLSLSPLLFVIRLFWLSAIGNQPVRVHRQLVFRQRRAGRRNLHCHAQFAFRFAFEDAARRRHVGVIAPDGHTNMTLVGAQMVSRSTPTPTKPWQ